ncbi:MAG: NAD-binding protein [Vicinamibacterales bacterium]
MAFGSHSSEQAGQPDPHWLLIRLSTAFVFLLGWLGFFLYARDNGLHTSPLSAPYSALQLFILHTPHLEGRFNLALEAARWLAPLVFGWATISGAVALFEKELRLLALPRRSGHVVICGLGRRGLELVRCFVGRGQKVVAIDKTADSESVRQAEYLGAIVVIGNVTDEATLRRARAPQAHTVVAVCGEDGTNVEISLRVSNLLGGSQVKRKSPLQCHVQLTDVALRASFQQTQALTQAPPRCRVQFFDPFEGHVRTVVQELPLDGDGVPVSDARRVRLVILGLGRMGEALALKAAQLGHFANRQPLQIAVIDRTAFLKKDRLLFRYPALATLCDLEFHALEIESPAARDRLQQWCDDEQTLTTVAICFDDDCRSADVALRLIPSLRTSRVAVRLSSGLGLATMLESWTTQSGSPARPFVFGMVREGHCERAFEDTEQDALARAAHEDFVRKRTTPTRTPQNERALRPWDELDNLYKDSNRQQSDHIGIKLRAVGCKAVPLDDPRPPTVFTTPEVELLAEMEHARWVAERSLAGWTFAPPPKDDAQRTSPYAVPWNRLDEVARRFAIADDVKDYDRDPVLSIPDILKSVGKKVVRTV